MHRIIHTPFQASLQEGVELVNRVPFFFIRLADASTQADITIPIDPINPKTMATITYLICCDHKKMVEKNKNQFFTNLVRLITEKLQLQGEKSLYFCLLFLNCIT
jgi:hypothetical protein